MSAETMTYGNVAPRLVENGYRRPLPIVAGEKRPAISSWQFSEGVVEGYDDATTTGCTFGDQGNGWALIGIDGDLPNRDIANAFAKECMLPALGVERVSSAGFPLRFGAKPKFALLAKCKDTDLRKFKSRVYADNKDAQYQVEIMAKGSQMVLYGQHPTAGKYTYDKDGLEPLALNLEDLPEVTTDQLRDIVRRFEKMADRTESLMRKGYGLADYKDARPLSDAANQQPDPDYTLAQAREELDELDPDLPEDDWWKIGSALCFQGNGSLEWFELFDEWSSQGAKYHHQSDDEIIKRWKSWKSNVGKKGKWNTIATLRKYVKQAGGKLYHSAPATTDDFPDLEDVDLEAIKNTIAEFTESDVGKVEGIIDDLVKGGVTGAKLEPILKKLKQTTGTPMGALRSAVKASQKVVKKSGKGDSDKSTQPEIAAAVVAEIRDTALSVDGRVWMWEAVSPGCWSKVSDASPRKTIAGFCDEMLQGAYSDGTVRSVLNLVKDQINREAPQFNQHGGTSIAVTNGNLTRADGKWHLGPHDREAFITSGLPVAYDPGAKAPLFEQFFRETFAGDKEQEAKSRLLLEVIGYTLMSTCQFEKFFIFLGVGANGKSVVLKVVEKLLGAQNVASVQVDKLADRFQRGFLQGKLANLVTEIPEGAQLADAEIKAITSGELITAEDKHFAPYTFHPTATMIFATNHLPHSRDFTHAMMRRAVILKFNNTVPEERQDKQLAEKLEAELPGILNLALEAVGHALDRGGFTECSDMKDAQVEWRLEADQVAMFVDEECVGDATERVSGTDLYRAFTQWGKEAGLRSLVTRKTFTRRLNQLGYESARTGAVRYITGLALRSMMSEAELPDLDISEELRKLFSDGKVPDWV
jgi:P4 family phage/plasmid primase-like protien